MRILVTGSSGQIGTNLALRLLPDGHDVFGVDKRVNAWTDDFRYLLQDLSGHYPSFPGGIGGVEYPEVDLVVHLAAHAKVHQLVRQPHRALENAVMTFNVLEFCRQQNLPIVFSSSREVYGDVHRFASEEASADFAYTESTYSASKIAGEAFVYSYARCYGLRIGVDECLARDLGGGVRSEEHTSELQSQSNLVCRLLLEKKTRPAAAHPPVDLAAERARIQERLPRPVTDDDLASYLMYPRVWLEIVQSLVMNGEGETLPT